jgi:hypothetical protein
MSYNTKNYTEQGGEKTVIGGQLDIAEGGTFSFNGAEFSPDNLPKAAAYQDDSEASNTAELVEDFNRLLGRLKAAGLMSTDAPVITILTQPEGTSVIAGSISGSISIEATVTGEGTLTYQWYSNTTESNTGGTLIEGATSEEFDIPNDLTVGTAYYYCVVGSLDAESVASEVAVITVEAPVITILTQPEDITVTEGAITESLTIEAAVTGEGELTYQWYSNTTESNSDGSEIADATSAEFSIPTDLTEGTYYYYCIVSSEGAESLASEVATVTVNAD